MLVSFELGHRSAATVALPALAAFRMPAVAFVVAGLVDTERPYWWQEAEYLAAQGGQARGLSARARAGGGGAVRAAGPGPAAQPGGAAGDLPPAGPGTPQLTSADLLALRGAASSWATTPWATPGWTPATTTRCARRVQGGHLRLARLTGESRGPSPTRTGCSTPGPNRCLRGLGYGSAFLSDGALFDLRGNGGERPDPLRISRLRERRNSRACSTGVLAGWNPAARRLRAAVAV
ncbi:hypothetical protein GXW82_18585 [Streptacidiphilus sp. 4-A2]|nr:hypothetical protein [Streptacidiphilus sp. 4-A2]